LIVWGLTLRRELRKGRLRRVRRTGSSRKGHDRVRDDYLLSPRPARLTDALDAAARGAGGFTFYGPRGAAVATLSFARLAAEARTLGAQLLSRGLTPGDRVCVAAETDADFIRALIGCLYAGLIACPMPTPAAFGARDAYLEQIARIADVAAPRAALAPASALDWVAAALAGRGLAFVGRAADLDNAPESALPPPGPPDAIAYVQFSSGTTSAPKGVAISHAAMMANLHAIAAHGLGLGEGDRGVGWLPLYHDMGLVGYVFTPIAAAAPVELLAPRDFVRRPGLWLELISRTRATMTYAPSFAYALAASRSHAAEGLDLSCLRVAGVGGDMVKPRNLDAFARAYAPAGFAASAFAPSYGMAEATLAVSFSPRGRGAAYERLDLAALQAGARRLAAPGAPGARRFALCGPALPGHRIAIRDADDVALPPGGVGRIVLSGPSLMSGYLNPQGAAAQALDADGWLDTGDLGYLTEGGEVVVTGRAKDMIIVNGRNIWPQDIEWALERAVEGVREGGVAAFGVGLAQAEGGGEADEGDGDAEEAVAVVIEHRGGGGAGDGGAGDGGAAREAMRARAAQAVRDRFGLGARIAFATAARLPRTSSGKLIRARAREMFLAGDFDA